MFCFITSRSELPRTRVASPSARRRALVTSTRVVAEVRQSRSRSSMPPLACGFTPMRRVPGGACVAGSPRTGCPSVVEQLLGLIAAHPVLELPVLRMVRGACRAAPGGRATCPRPACRRRIFGPVQPLGERRMIIGQAGRGVISPPRPRPGCRRCGPAPRPAPPPSPGASAPGSWPDHDHRRPAIAAEQAQQLLLRDARQHRGAGDLVAVQVQDRQHRAVARRASGIRCSASSRPPPRSPPRRRRPRSVAISPGLSNTAPAACSIE